MSMVKKRNSPIDAELLEESLNRRLELALKEINEYPIRKQEFRDPVVSPTTLSTNILIHFHPVFRLFQNTLIGKSAFVFGNGPSLEKLKRIEKPSNSVFLGAKGIFHHPRISELLDFYFFGDRYNQPGDNYSAEQLQFLENTKHNRDLVKLCSSTRQGQYLIPHGVYDTEVIKLVREYQVIPFDTVNGFEISGEDIAEFPLPAINIVFPAIIFALYCGVKKIFLVGCDCTDKGHFYESKRAPIVANTIFTNQYEEIAKQFNIDFTVVNPVCLQVFKNINTEIIGDGSQFSS